MQRIERPEAERDQFAGAALDFSIQRHVDGGAVDPERRGEPAVLLRIRVVLDQVSGGAYEGDLAGLSAGDDDRDGRGLVTHARVPLIIERALERAHVEIYTLH